jgi:hypothetical protein
VKKAETVSGSSAASAAGLKAEVTKSVIVLAFVFGFFGLGVFGGFGDFGTRGAFSALAFLTFGTAGAFADFVGLSVLAFLADFEGFASANISRFDSSLGWATECSIASSSPRSIRRRFAIDSPVSVLGAAATSQLSAE